MTVIDEEEDSDDSDNNLDSHIKTLEDKDKKKGVSKKDSLTVYSTDFLAMCNIILFYFIFTRHSTHIIY